MRKLFKKVFVIVMSMVVLFSSIQPAMASASEVVHIDHEHYLEADYGIMPLHNCDHYFDVELKFRVELIATDEICTADVYYYEWRCTYQGCKVVYELDHNYTYNFVHDWRSFQSGLRCFSCRMRK